MLPSFLFQYLIVVTDLVVFIFIGYYLLKLRDKEKALDKKELRTDSNYHHIVDDTLVKEKKILDEATKEASEILTGAQYIQHSSKDAVDKALQALLNDIQKQAGATAHEFITNYQSSLKQQTSQSLTEYQEIMKTFEVDLQKQTKEFRESLLPNLEKQLEEYKQVRLKEIEQTIIKIVQKASEEIFNKSIPLEMHQNLVIESLEKAKQQGVFD